MVPILCLDEAICMESDSLRGWLAFDFDFDLTVSAFNFLLAESNKNLWRIEAS